MYPFLSYGWVTLLVSVIGMPASIVGVLWLGDHASGPRRCPATQGKESWTEILRVLERATLALT
jgi:hypothetical protein